MKENRHIMSAVSSTQHFHTSIDRKTKKPLMEKRRRARINKYVIELKDLLLSPLNKDPSRTSKMEKADILEMTVQLLRQYQYRNLSRAVSADRNILTKYQNGYQECRDVVTKYTKSNSNGFDPSVGSRLLNHLDGQLECQKHLLNHAHKVHQNIQRLPTFTKQANPIGQFPPTPVPPQVNPMTPWMILANSIPKPETAVNSRLLVNAAIASFPQNPTLKISPSESESSESTNPESQEKNNNNVWRPFEI